MRPVVGIAGYSDQARWDIWDLPAVLISRGYVDAVAGAGAVPVVLSPSANPEEAVSRLDGLVLSAGPDVDPAHYGGERHPQLELRPGRDEPELALLAAAEEAEIPVLGICRGMQLLAIAHGGSLFAHLPESLGSDRHCPDGKEIARHPVSAVPGSRVAAALGPRRVVSSHHHQGVCEAGDLLVTARADDSLAEAVEDPGRTFVVGVQWHAELEHPELFAAFAEACAERAGEREAAHAGR